MSAPFEIGEHVRPDRLVGWTYSGVTGIPGADRDAVRRYLKGDWVLELRAFVDRSRPARVVAIRTRAEDAQWWANERDRRRPRGRI